MILIAGIPSEQPVALAVEAAEELGIGYVLFDQRDNAASDLRLTFDPTAGWQGVLDLPTGRVDLASLTGVYARLMDDRFLPAVRDLPAEAPERLRCARFHRLFNEWLDVAAIRVVNRPRAMMSNCSKTYQATLIRRAGFRVPDTLVSNDPDAVIGFASGCAADGDGVIYKSISGARSIVQTFSDADHARLHRVRWCPTQFQRQVKGYDVRVHVVGDAVFAARIVSDATDYRYAARQSGTDAEVSAADLPHDLSRACIKLSAALELPFTGIDLRIDDDGGVVCFEANPCPAYSYYQTRTGTPIAAALVRWLAR